MKINNYRFCIVFFLIGLIYSCQKQAKNKPEFRLANTTNTPIKVDLTNKKTVENSFQINSFSTLNYQSVTPNSYKVIIAANNNKPILKKEYGLASEEKYTAILYGKPGLSSTTNQQTNNDKLHDVFAGAENHTKNGFLPKLFLFRDRISVTKGSASLRIFNAAVGTSPLTFQLKRNNTTKKLTKGLAYGKPMLSTAVKKGKIQLEVLLSNSPKPILTKEINLESKKIYTIILFKKETDISVSVLKTMADS